MREGNGGGSFFIPIGWVLDFLLHNGNWVGEELPLSHHCFLWGQEASGYCLLFYSKVFLHPFLGRLGEDAC